MSIDYDLHIENSGINRKLIKEVLSELSIEVISEGQRERGFYYSKFNPDIKTYISFNRMRKYSEDHPRNARGTEFLAQDFNRNEVLTYTPENVFDPDITIMQYTVIISSAMEITRIIDKDTLFTNNNEDTYYFINGTFYFMKNFYDWFKSKRPSYEAILGKYNCVIFDGNPL